jgi:hypothetical protein
MSRVEDADTMFPQNVGTHIPKYACHSPQDQKESSILHNLMFSKC